jgi:hypothetical protein
MKRLSALRGADLNRVRRWLGHLAEARDLPALGKQVIAEGGRLLPADHYLWDVWQPDMSAMRVGETVTNLDHQEVSVSQYESALRATIWDHPMFAAGGIPLMTHRPQRMSDFQAYGEFKHNPLFREVYRHLDSHFQLVFKILELPDRVVSLTWNRRALDFSERERELLDVMGRGVGIIGRRIAEREKLETACQTIHSVLKRPAFGGHWGLEPGGRLPLLSAQEGRMLAGLLRGRPREEIAAKIGWRRDLLDRRLAALRDRLGFENTAQLLSTLVALKAPSLK